MFVSGTFSSRPYIDRCCRRRYRHGWNTISCALKMQSPVRGTLSSQPSHLPQMEFVHVTTNNRSVGRMLEGLGYLSVISVGMCSEAKVCRSVASQSTAITRQTFGLFVANSSTTHTHLCHMRICERATDSSIRMKGLVFLKYVASIIGQIPTSLALAACTCTQPSQ